MIENSKATISALVVHRIGSKSEGEDVSFSRSVLDTSAFAEEVPDILKQYFFKPFRTEAYYNLVTQADGEPVDNSVFRAACRVFDDPSAFYDASVEIAGFLHFNSNHPNIRRGEFYMALFDDCVVDGQTCRALGIFKSENKEVFLKVFMQGDNFELGTQEGINLRKLDKGCIIFDIELDEGFRVCAVDNINRGQDAKFWMQDFLNVCPREDKFFYTNNYLQMCRNFVTDVFNEDNNVPRAEQIDLMNRSIDYFTKESEFDSRAFEQAVLAQPEVAEAFNDYKAEFEAKNDLPQSLPMQFEISKDAVKGEKRNFKSVLKLDKNFHVYIHGSRQYLEKGYDEQRDMNFYKLYFRAEQ